MSLPRPGKADMDKPKKGQPRPAYAGSGLRRDKVASSVAATACGLALTGLASALGCFGGGGGALSPSGTLLVILVRSTSTLTGFSLAPLACTGR